MSLTKRKRKNGNGWKKKKSDDKLIYIYIYIEERNNSCGNQDLKKKKRFLLDSACS